MDLRFNTLIQKHITSNAFSVDIMYLVVFVKSSQLNLLSSNLLFTLPNHYFPLPHILFKQFFQKLKCIQPYIFLFLFSKLSIQTLPLAKEFFISLNIKTAKERPCKFKHLLNSVSSLTQQRAGELNVQSPVLTRRGEWALLEQQVRKLPIILGNQVQLLSGASVNRVSRVCELQRIYDFLPDPSQRQVKMLTSVLSILQTLGKILLIRLLPGRPSSILPAIFTNIIFQLPCWVITEEFQEGSENSVRGLSSHLMILLLHFLATLEQFR